MTKIEDSISKMRESRTFITEFLLNSVKHRTQICSDDLSKVYQITFPVIRRRELNLKQGTPNDRVLLFWNPEHQIGMVLTPEKYDELMRNENDMKEGKTPASITSSSCDRNNSQKDEIGV